MTKIVTQSVIVLLTDRIIVKISLFAGDPWALRSPTLKLKSATVGIRKLL